LALFLGFIFAVAAGISHFAGWACDLDAFGNCTNSQALACAAAVMFIAYLFLQRLESDPRAPQSRKTEPPVAKTSLPAERVTWERTQAGSSGRS
jgi:hypothetical protein